MTIEKNSTAQVARASAALEAAGAFDASPTTVSIGPQTQSLTVRFAYTRGGAAGYARVGIELSSDGTTWYSPTLADGTVGGTAPYGVLPLRVLQYDLPAPASGGVLRSSFALDVSPWRYARFPCAEVGNTGAPGTLVLDVTEDAS